MLVHSSLQERTDAIILCGEVHDGGRRGYALDRLDSKLLLIVSIQLALSAKRQSTFDD